MSSRDGILGRVILKRSISDLEIALIKEMLFRGMKNKEIQFYFNSPERSVNSGRISDIKSGKYSNSNSISASGKEKLNEFLSNFASEGATISISDTAIKIPMSETTDPLSQELLFSFFKKATDGNLIFLKGESDEFECKENFSLSSSSKWLKPIGALSNNKGGYVVFGVKDPKSQSDKTEKRFIASGLITDHFTDCDPAEFSKKIKSTFSPTPRVECKTIEIHGAKLGFMRVEAHKSKPVIAEKGDGSDIKEGDILFRYPGQSTRIKYSDLRSILDERDATARQEILPILQKLLTADPKNVVLADLENGEISDGDTSFVVDDDLINKIKFIKEGEFDNVSGKPTLKVVGELKSQISKFPEIQKHGLTSSDILSDFLSGTTVSNPEEYIKCAVHNTNGAWMPVRFFASQAKFNLAELKHYIKSLGASEKRTKIYIDRAVKENSAWYERSSSTKVLSNQIQSGELPVLLDQSQATDFSVAICGLQQCPSLKFLEIAEHLREAWEIIKQHSPDRSSDVRKAAARLDQLYFTLSKN